MTALARKVAALAGVSEDRIERLSGGDLSEVLRCRRADGRLTVGKASAAPSVEAVMLRTIRSASIPTPEVQSEHEDVLLMDYVPNDGVFSPSAWRDIGLALRRLHDRCDDRYGWPVDYRIGSITLDNRQGSDWPTFWVEQRLRMTASVLDRPWRERIDGLAARMPDLLPAVPRPSLLHGDLWTGNILVSEGKLAALIDPACYYGHEEVDLAMLALFADPPEDFWTSYGAPEAGFDERRPIYQLFPALVHLRLFGGAYAAMVDRLLERVGC